MYIPFNEIQVSTVLPEKRVRLGASYPDLFMCFATINTLYIYDGIIDKLDKQWKDSLTLWQGQLDIRIPKVETEREYVDNEYSYVDFGVIPQVSSLTDEDIKLTPFAWDNNEIVIHHDFIAALKKAGANCIWFNTLRDN